LRRLIKKARKFLTIGGIHHPKAGTNRFYIKPGNGGLGLVKLEFAYNAAVVGLSEYIKRCKDRLTRLVQEYDTKKAKHSQQKEANLIKQKYMK
jgi:hypothetical protein